jgi:hypothetical protein
MVQQARGARERVMGESRVRICSTVRALSSWQDTTSSPDVEEIMDI